MRSSEVSCWSKKKGSCQENSVRVAMIKSQI
jgi:hypothetical protein